MKVVTGQVRRGRPASDAPRSPTSRFLVRNAPSVGGFGRLAEPHHTLWLYRGPMIQRAPITMNDHSESVRVLLENLVSTRAWIGLRSTTTADRTCPWEGQ